MIQIPTRTPQTLPPLENGDRLSCDEFKRRYEAMPEDCKAELIEGIVYGQQRCGLKVMVVPMRVYSPG